MPTMSYSLKSMVSVLFQTIMLSVVLFLTGCNNNPTVKEGAQYIQMQADQITYNAYATQLDITQKQLTQVLPEFQEVTPIPPQSRVNDLAAWLENNNCLIPVLSPTDRVQCYQVTRVYLIQKTKELDTQDTTLWAAKRTIQQLVSNMNKIIEMAPRQGKDDLKPP